MTVMQPQDAVSLGLRLGTVRCEYTCDEGVKRPGSTNGHALQLNPGM